ncbi:putative uncharacterized protein DDB_G0282133 [Polyergus mexicanus]|uniref:putative uncharacterized protein DDB_G0282133 n=1 Tax=Polyergus mexicanus TaxID=615972 RepID=UPI0038B5C006
MVDQKESKDDLSTIAKNLNTNNPCIVLENIKLIINDNNRTTEMSQDICTTNMNYINKHINTNSLSNAINFENNTVFSLDNGHNHNAKEKTGLGVPSLRREFVASPKATLPIFYEKRKTGLGVLNLRREFSTPQTIRPPKCNGDHPVVGSSLPLTGVPVGRCTPEFHGKDHPGRNDNALSANRHNDKDHNIVDSAINVNNSANATDFDKNVIYSYENEHGHDALTLNDKNYINNPKKHADCDNAMIFSNNCDNKRSRAIKLNVTFFCDNDNSYKTVNSDINTNNSTYGNDPDNNISLFRDDNRDHNIVNSTINTNNSTNDFDKNVIFSYDNGNGYLPQPPESVRRLEIQNDPENTLKEKENGVGSIQPPPRVCGISESDPTDLTRKEENWVGRTQPPPRVLDTSNNSVHLRATAIIQCIVDSANNVNDSANGTDFDKNVIYSYDNEHGHDALTLHDKNYINNPKKHADCDNAMIFSNDCDNKRSRAIKLNVIFSCDNDNSYKTVDSDINTNNSTCGNDPDNNISLFCDDDRDYNIVNSRVGKVTL